MSVGGIKGGVATGLYYADKFLTWTSPDPYDLTPAY